jgi:asparagine synthase (glutamine-hydrolysing)
MGSIAAVFSDHPQAQRASVERMLGAAPHRGRVARTIDHGRCLLGTTHGDSPDDASLEVYEEMAAAFSGALDNAAELATRLEQRGVRNVPQTAAGLVAAVYKEFGQQAPALFRGVFSAVVSDGKQLWCFRDHLGLKPLFYRSDASGFFAATEAKQVAAGAGLTPEPDLDVLEQIFHDNFDDDTPSALRGVKRLRKSTVLHSGGSGERATAYWHPEDLIETVRLSDAEVQERFDDLMEQAVRRMMTGNDVVSLSGGIDSPAVAAFAAPAHLELFDKPLEALSAVYPHLPSVDESEYIEIVAGALDLPLHTYERRAQPLYDIDKWVRTLDGPVPKILTSDALEHYEHARRRGFDTMLTGEIAEFVIDLRAYLVPHFLLRGKLGPAAMFFRHQRAAGVSWSAIARQISDAFVPAPLQALYRRWRLPSRGARVPHWVDSGRFRRGRADLVTSPRNRWRQNQLVGMMGPGLTIEADDICQAVCGISVRRPWADVDLWEFFLTLPAETKYPSPGRKQLARRLLRGRVPDPILDRKDKTGFEDSIMERIDYDALGGWLIDPPHRIPGVDYKALAQRLEQRDLDVSDHVWAKDLAAVHAFLASFDH